MISHGRELNAKIAGRFEKIKQKIGTQIGQQCLVFCYFHKAVEDLGYEPNEHFFTIKSFLDQVTQAISLPLKQIQSEHIDDEDQDQIENLSDEENYSVRKNFDEIGYIKEIKRLDRQLKKLKMQRALYEQKEFMSRVQQDKNLEQMNHQNYLDLLEQIEQEKKEQEEIDKLKVEEEKAQRQKRLQEASLKRQVYKESIKEHERLNKRNISENPYYKIVEQQKMEMKQQLSKRKSLHIQNLSNTIQTHQRNIEELKKKCSQRRNKVKFRKNEKLNHKNIIENAFKSHKEDVMNNTLSALNFCQKVKAEMKPLVDYKRIKEREESLNAKNLKNKEREEKIRKNMEKAKYYLKEGMGAPPPSKKEDSRSKTMFKENDIPLPFKKINYLPELKKHKHLRKKQDSLEQMIKKNTLDDNKIKNILKKLKQRDERVEQLCEAGNISERLIGKQKFDEIGNLYKEILKNKLDFIEKLNQFLSEIMGVKKKESTKKCFSNFQKAKGIIASFFLIAVCCLSFYFTFHQEGFLAYCCVFYGLFILDSLVITALHFSNPGVFDRETKSNQQNQPQNKDQDTSIQFRNIEKNFCQVCVQNQPIRTKHCKVCNVCILTFDHHCFWLGNCIGEKNKAFFFLSLSFFSIQSLLLLVFNAWSLKESKTNMYEKIGFLFLSGLLFLNMWYLLAFHTYLMLNNLTTWEKLSWERISYLESFERKNGSPFCQGWRKNLRFYWKARTVQFWKWRVLNKDIRKGDKKVSDIPSLKLNNTQSINMITNQEFEYKFVC